MRLGNLLGVTAPMIVLAYPEWEDALPLFDLLASTGNNEILADAQKEFQMLLNLRTYLDYEYVTDISGELGDVYCENGLINGNRKLGEALEREIIERVLVQLMSWSKVGKHKDSSRLEATVAKYVKEKTFPVSRVKKVAREIANLLPDATKCTTQELLLKYPLQQTFCDTVIVNGKKHHLTESEKTVCEYYISRLPDVEQWVNKLYTSGVMEETIFGIPFFQLVKRKPESIRYAVLNAFEYAKRGNDKILLSVAEAVRRDTLRFKELFLQYVNGVSDVEVVVLDCSYAEEILSSVSDETSEIFKTMLHSGCLNSNDFLQKDFEILVDLCERLVNLHSDKELNACFGLNISGWDKFGEELTNIGVYGINTGSLELFADAVKCTILSGSKIYRSEEVINKFKNIIQNDVEALLDTIIPVGEVIG